MKDLHSSGTGFAHALRFKNLIRKIRQTERDPHKTCTGFWFQLPTQNPHNTRTAKLHRTRTVSAHNYYTKIHLKILALAVYQTVPEPHGSCTRLLLTIAHLKTALYPRENCTGPVPGPYGFGLPARARIAHILPSKALHRHVGWVG